MEGINMNHMKTLKIAHVASIWVFILLVNGCTVKYKIDADPVVDYSTRHKLNTSIRLDLPDTLCNYTWEHKTALGDTFRMELGPALCSNAEAMTRSLFNHVVVSRGSQDAKASNTTAILTPRVVSVERAMGVFAFSDMKTIIDLEWALTDLKDDLIWVQTIQGIGKAKTGNILSHKSEARKQGKRAIQDVFQKSVEAIMSSPEIRAFVESQ